MSENKKISERKTNINTGHPQITIKRGKTTFKIGICFNEKCKETLDDRIKKLIRREVNKYDG